MYNGYKYAVGKYALYKTSYEILTHVEVTPVGQFTGKDMDPITLIILKDTNPCAVFGRQWKIDWELDFYKTEEEAKAAVEAYNNNPNNFDYR